MKLSRIAFDFLQGLILGYPVCCILHFCFDTLRGRPSAAERGITKNGYVPCKWHIDRNIIKRVKIEKCRLKEYLDEGYQVSGVIQSNGSIKVFVEITE